MRLKIGLLLSLVLACAVLAAGQGSTVGTVVEVLDGQTIKVETSPGITLVVKLRYIETPTENQELYETIKEHLSTFVLGKAIELRSPEFHGDSLVVTAILNGTDLSAQMLRDGAAWYYPDGQSIPKELDLRNFMAMEAAAKQEIRGVWSIPGLARPSTIKEIAAESEDPMNDRNVDKAAVSILGDAMEHVFGPEPLTDEAGDCGGKVVAVVDGDTVKVLGSSNRLMTVRLQGIDAPEKRQAFGMAAKQHLSDMVFGKSVTCSYTKRDRYGRVIGKIGVDGRDVNLQMVSDCFAWHYKEYQKEQSPSDRTAYADAESRARNGRCGIWKDGNAIKPSDFRRERFLALYTNVYEDTTEPNSGGYSGGSSYGGGSGPVRVRSYTRRDGTVVRSHTRSRPR